MLTAASVTHARADRKGVSVWIPAPPPACKIARSATNRDRDSDNAPCHWIFCVVQSQNYKGSNDCRNNKEKRWHKSERVAPGLCRITETGSAEDVRQAQKRQRQD